MVNKVTLLGNLGQDPNTKHLENGQQVTSLSIATSKQWKDSTSGEKKSETQWHNLILWNGLSKVAEQYLKKGSKIYVEGELTHRSYDDKDGNKRYITEVVVKDLKMLGESSSQVSNIPPPNPPAQNIPVVNNGNNDEDDLPF